MDVLCQRLDAQLGKAADSNLTVHHATLLSTTNTDTSSLYSRGCRLLFLLWPILLTLASDLPSTRCAQEAAVGSGYRVRCYGEALLTDLAVLHLAWERCMMLLKDGASNVIIVIVGAGIPFALLKGLAILDLVDDFLLLLLLGIVDLGLLSPG